MVWACNLRGTRILRWKWAHQASSLAFTVKVKLMLKKPLLQILKQGQRVLKLAFLEGEE